MTHKPEYPPLLPQGLHKFSIKQVRSLCVDAFPLSRSRAGMMAAFELIYEQARTIGLHGEFWIDGSFLTEKIEPDDIDFVLFTPAHFYDSGTIEQRGFLDWLIDTEDDPRTSFRCDTDIVLVYEESHPEHGRYLDIADHWENNIYGRSVNTGKPKGIIVVNLKEGLVV